MRAHLAILVLAGACSGPGDRPAPSAATTAPAADRAPAPAAARGRAAPPAAPDEAVALGRERVAVEPSAEARAAQARAEAAFERGDHAAALGAWQEVLRLAPDFDAARVGLARALARTGDLDGAERALRVALSHDLVRFRSTWLEHEDLATLRGSARGAVIASLVTALEAELERAIAIGLPVVEWREVPFETRYDRSVDPVISHSARAALWVEPWHRYVLVTPPRRAAISATIDRPHRRSLVVAGDPVEETDVGYRMGHTRVDLFALDASATPIATWTPGDVWTLGFLLGDAETVGACTWSAEGDEGRFLLGRTGARRAADAVGCDDLDLRVEAMGIGHRPTPAGGFTVERERVVTPRGPIPLEPGRGPGFAHEVLASSDGSRAVVLSCGCPARSDTDAYELCFADALDLGTLTARRIAARAHVAQVAIDQAGGIYVQTRAPGPRDGPITTVRYAAPDAAPVPLPAGLILERARDELCWPSGP